MASEKKPSQSLLAGMTAKQKITAGAFVVVFLVLIWQIVGLFGGGSKSVPTPPPSTTPTTSNMAANAPGGPATPPSSSTPSATGQMIPQTNLRQMPVMSDIQFQQMQQKTEEKYIGKINELEELKVQKEIAETNQAIAAAKLATVTAEKSISDLLTKPAAPVLTPGSYANSLILPARPGEQISGVTGELPPGGLAPPAPPPPVTAPKVDYSVISVTMQLHKWTAVLGYQGKLYSVTIGDTLPPDGSVIVSISKNAVILKKDDEIRKLSILGTI